MSWVDEFLASSLFIWTIIGIIALHFYMRRTGKTFLDIVHDIRDFFNGLDEEVK